MRTLWSNWLGNHSASPTNITAPSNVGEVIQAIEAAKLRHQRLRVLGAGFAWSPLVPTDGCIISTKNLCAVRDIDPRRHRITVEAGMLLRDLVDIAQRNGMSVKSPAMFLGLSVGGLIATGSHGTGRNVATFGDAVVGFELVQPNGEVVKVTSPGSELWRAVITNLGTLGVVTSVTLQCEPLYNVQELHIRVPVSETAALLPKMLGEYEFVAIFWYPSSSWALYKVGNRTNLPAGDSEGRIRPLFRDRMRGWFGGVLPAISDRVPFLSNAVGSLLNAGIGTGAQVVSEPYFSHYQQAYPRVISSEFAVPTDLAPDAWTWLYLRLIQYWRAGGVRPVNLLAHARFSSASEAFLASSSGRATCHLEVVSFDRNRQRELFLGEFHQKMSSSFGGRPHWGKDISNHWHAARGYGENLDRFLEVRHDLDPHQLFLNPFLRDEVFGIARRVVRARVAGTHTSLFPMMKADREQARA